MTTTMKIAVVSRGDETCGGASRVAEDLARQMAMKGHHTTHFVTWTGKGWTEDRQSLYGPGGLRVATTFAHRAARKFGMAEMVPFELPVAATRLSGFDIVHFHDISGSISPLTIAAAARHAAVAWTFHDCSPFTGGCLYPQMADCEKYKVGCGGCPLANEWPIYGWADMTPHSLRMRKRLFGSGKVSLVTPSDWMADIAWESGNVDRRPTVISNMVDTSLFRPAEDRELIRKKLGLPADRPVIAISAASIADERKNVIQAISGVVKAGAVRPFVVLIGKPDPKSHTFMPGIEFIATGYVSDRRELAEWLSAADAFMATPKADNQPLAVMEALACGTPVYGWPTGGIREMVADGVNGRMVENDVEQLGHRLQEDWLSGKMTGMREATGVMAASEYAPEVFARRHEDHYRSLIQERKSAS
jgi:glycosyltransferase involved in cell wall biosynthesis|nr:glycosyltransferase [Neorhizobium tomejilense]